MTLDTQYIHEILSSASRTLSPGHPGRCHGAHARKPRALGGAGPAANPVLSRRALLPALATGSAALLAASAAQPASAGTGAAGASVISFPDLLRITAEEWLSLPTDKALSRIGSLTEERVVSIAEQLEEGQG